MLEWGEAKLWAAVRSTQMKQSEVDRVNEGGDEGGEMETRNDRPTLKTSDILFW